MEWLETVCICPAGLASDRAFHEEISDMIKEGCIRTVIILSPDYVSSPWCGFEANLAFIRAPGNRQFNGNTSQNVQ